MAKKPSLLDLLVQLYLFFFFNMGYIHTYIILGLGNNLVQKH